ncbi:MAG: MATE family efflux transporter [Pseudomonadales bacterium]
MWLLAWPVMLSNISQPLLGLVDTAVIGHLSQSLYLAAVAIGTTIFSFIYWSFGFLRMGTTGVIAQSVGGEDGAKNRTVLAQSLVLALAIACVLLVLQTPIIEFALTLMAPQPELLEEARSYAQIRIYGAPAVLCNYVLLGWFVGNQNTRVLLILLVVTNLINIVLDVLAVTVLGWKTQGLAIATVISEYAGVCLALWYCRAMLVKVPGSVVMEQLKRFSAYLPLLSVNRYLFVRTVLLLLAMSFFTAQGAAQGVDTLAANALLMTFVMLLSYGLDGFAHAIEALAGKAIGARNLDAFYSLTRAAALGSVLMALVFSAFFWLFGPLLIDLLTSIEAVRNLAALYLPWVVLIPLLAVVSYLLDGVFIGTTQVRTMQWAMLVSVCGVYFPLWWLTQGLGNQGLWLSLCGLYVARALTSVYGFYRLSAAGLWLKS